ncbi:unnamed protein product [Brassica oleracea var. botrytis]|nr:hypothetical protein HID58_041600 [Brassica napus]CAF2071218.1 unnamed protein product [Brassica napus]VDD49436.1 unnamed protein product [Brassica oleracea]
MFGFGCECFCLSRGISEFDLESSEPKPFWLSSPLPCWPHDPRCRSTSMSRRSLHLPQCFGYQKCAQPLSRALGLEPFRTVSTPPMCTTNVVITRVIGKYGKILMESHQKLSDGSIHS